MNVFMFYKTIQGTNTLCKICSQCLGYGRWSTHINFILFFPVVLVWKIQAMSSKAVSYKTLEIYTEGQNYKSMFSHLRTIRGVWYYMEISPHLWPIIWPGFWNILVVYFSNSGICHFLLYSFGIEYMLPTLVIAFLSIHSCFSNFISNS